MPPKTIRPPGDADLGGRSALRKPTRDRTVCISYQIVPIDPAYPRKLLRDAVTGEWLTAGGSFSTESVNALEIGSWAQAYDLQKQSQRRLELVIKFSRDEDDFVMPL